MQSLVHATSALAYVNAARTLMSDEDIDTLSENKIMISEYATYVESIQKKSAAQLKK